MNKIILDEIMALADEKKAQHLLRFFKTAKGQYGEGDLFLGINVPVVRAVAKKYYECVSLDDIQILIKNEYHEVRLLALMLMVFKYEKTDQKKEVFELYLENVEYINNWDLVDLSAPKILGAYAHSIKDYSSIYELAQVEHLWSNRIAVVSNWYIIKQGDFSVILNLSERFLLHKHDLMQKAVGWMLREMGKRDLTPLYAFLDKHHRVMPRTMLRYSIEKMDKETRERYMYPDKDNP